MGTLKTAIFIQARSRSSRLPGKIFKRLPEGGEHTLIEHIFHKLSGVVEAGETALLIPESEPELIAWCHRRRLPFYTGSDSDVRERYRIAALKTGADIVVRATGDNPCVDPEIVSDTIAEILGGGSDLVSFTNLPLGVAVEAIRTPALMSDHFPATAEHREHVSLHIKHNPAHYKVAHLEHPLMDAFPEKELPRLTVDTEADLQVVRKVFQKLGAHFTTGDVLSLYRENPEIFAGNRHVRQLAFP